MGKKTRRFTRTAEENDTFSRVWRRRYCYLQRAGATSKIKRGARRRERREGKAETNADYWD